MRRAKRIYKRTLVVDSATIQKRLFANFRRQTRANGIIPVLQLPGVLVETDIKKVELFSMQFPSVYSADSPV